MPQGTIGNDKLCVATTRASGLSMVVACNLMLSSSLRAELQAYYYKV